MTCIVGATNGKRVVIGGDSFSGNSNEAHISKSPKVFKNGKMIFGCAGSWRMQQIIETIKFPKFTKEHSPRMYLIQEIVPILRAEFKAHGFTEISNNVEKGGFALIGLKGELFALQSDFSIVDTESDFASIGAGYEYALGAMQVLFGDLPMSQETKKSITARLGKALQVSCILSPFVNAPFTCISE